MADQPRRDEYSWHFGPPKSESESWNHHRRDELLSITVGLLGAEVAGMAKSEEWNSESGDAFDKIDVGACVRLALRVRDAVDQAVPRI